MTIYYKNARAPPKNSVWVLFAIIFFLGERVKYIAAVASVTWTDGQRVTSEEGSLSTTFREPTIVCFRGLHEWIKNGRENTECTSRTYLYNILLFSFWWYFPPPLCISLRRAKRKKSISGNCDVRIERDNIYKSFIFLVTRWNRVHIYICRYKIIPNVLSSSLIGFLRLNCTIVFKKNMNFFHIPIKRRVLCIFFIKVKCGKNL